MDGTTNIIELKGIGEKTATAFGRLGIRDIDSLITMYPKYYLTYEDPKDIHELEIGQRVSIAVRINSEVHIQYARRMKIVTCTAKDHTGTIMLVWYNMPYLKKQLHQGRDYIFTGTPIYKNGRITMEHPEIFTPEDYEAKQETLQPVYPLTSGLTNKLVSKAMFQTKDYIFQIPEYLPQSILDQYHPMEYNKAIWNIHFPESKEKLIEAKKRLIFDEFFIFISAMHMITSGEDIKEEGYKIGVCKEAKDLIANLPYELTGAQKRALNEMAKDMASGKVMNRLVQGDVGSGKTILAVVLLLMCAKAGYQGVLMAPTEVLATQHYESFMELLSPYGIRIALLTGSTKAKEKRETYQKIKDGEIDIVIGTHAVIQDKVEYHKLALVITDEQHRFGVRQRESLSLKGEKPHVLVMSATPIPRTLAIILYGDLDVSIIDELPAERLPIKNCVVNTSYRPTAYRFIEKQVSQGRQVYVICPMVEESETMEGENVIQYAQMLRSQFAPSVRISYLHGKMKAADKQKVMDDFSDGLIDVLVSTTVVEVGVNVPNATVMMVENAERFGLAQLHQLRGRVGRGEYQSYCIFVTGNKSEKIRKRLEILNKSNDGFKIAEEDLRLRGPGDFFGVRQSGDFDFGIADVFTDAKTLKEASDAAKDMLKKDPELKLENNVYLKQKVAEYTIKCLEKINL